jgi:hypothetical protein
MSICYVTAFLDIGREKWKHFPRCFDIYLQSFLPFLNLWRNDNNNLYIFIDERYFQTLSDITKNFNNIDLIRINEETLKKYSPMWSKMEKEQEIMNNIEFQTLIEHRKNCPETNNPKYTLINHGKIDFVHYISKNIDKDFLQYIWFDFGYFNDKKNIPYQLIDVDKLNSDKINYTLISPLDDSDKDIIYTLSVAPERIGGFFFSGNKNSIEKYQKLYHKIHQEMQEQNIVDDDQHIALRCYFRNKELFHLHETNGWHKAFLYFQKNLPSLTQIMNKHGSDKGNGHHNYTELYSQLFEKKRFANLNLLEIGIGTKNPNILSSMCGANSNYQSGASLRGWKEYFPNAEIYGCDRDKEILFQENRITTFDVDQTDVQSLQKNIVNRNIMFDIIIDDGLHLFPVNYCVFKTIFCKLNKDGIYVIEDVMKFDNNVFNDPFLSNLDFQYVEYPNPKNNCDNNLIIIKRKNT